MHVANSFLLFLLLHSYVISLFLGKAYLCSGHVHFISFLLLYQIIVDTKKIQQNFFLLVNKGTRSSCGNNSLLNTSASAPTCIRIRHCLYVLCDSTCLPQFLLLNTFIHKINILFHRSFLLLTLNSS